MMRVRCHFGFVAVVNCALAALVVAVLAAFVPAAAAEDKAVFDYVVLIDVSGSMVGPAGGAGHAAAAKLTTDAAASCRNDACAVFTAHLRR